MVKFLKTIISLSLCMTLVACSKGQAEQEETAEPTTSAIVAENKVYGIWYSYKDYQRECQGMSEEEFSAYCDTAVANMTTLGINTLYLHAIAFTDALYSSSIYPKSVYMNVEYDPFLIFSTKAKEAGMHVEAWINPMRSIAVSEADSLSDDSQIKQWILENNERVRQVSDRYYLNPAYPEVRELILSVVNELLDQYDIDGIHMDDYFYPYGTEKNFDALAYSKALEENSELTLEDFRMNNVDQMVAEIYQAVKAKDSSLWFGISPAGNIDNCINQLYGNPYHWVEQGTIDYLEPQIYWGYNHPTKPYLSTLEEWKAVIGESDVLYIPGLAAYCIGETYDLGSDEANYEWVNNSDLMARQTSDAINAGCDGVIYFSYTSFFAPTDSTLDQVNTEMENLKSVIQANQ